MLHVLALGLSHEWEQRSDGLWLRQELLPAKLERSAMTLMPEQHKLNAEQREEARRLMGEGNTPPGGRALWRVAHGHLAVDESRAS